MASSGGSSSSGSGGGIRGGSSGSAYSGGSGGGLSGYGGAMGAPIGGLGGYSGTPSQGAGFEAVAPTYAGGWNGLRDSRSFEALNRGAQEYMQAGSPGSYYAWRHPQGGAPGGGGPGGAPGGGASLQDLLATMFMQQQQARANYAQLFASAPMNLEGPTTMPQPTQQTGANYNTYSNRPSYGY